MNNSGISGRRGVCSCEIFNLTSTFNWKVIEIQRPWEAVCSHFEDNKWPRWACFNQHMERRKKTKKKQVKPPTILSAASWPRLQFQLTPVDDAAANRCWLGDGCVDRAPSVLDHLQTNERAHFWNPREPTAFGKASLRLWGAVSQLFYLQPWLEDASENLLKKSTCCFSYTFRFKRVVHRILHRLGSSLKIRFYIKPTFTRSHSHDGKHQPHQVGENHYSDVWIMHAETATLNVDLDRKQGLCLNIHPDLQLTCFFSVFSPLGWIFRYFCATAIWSSAEAA